MTPREGGGECCTARNAPPRPAPPHHSTLPAKEVRVALGRASR